MESFLTGSYYVYNDLGQFAYVLPPLASDNLPTNGEAYSGSNDYWPLI